MKVTFVDLKGQYHSIKNNIDKAIFDVINETAFIGGKYIDEFETQFASIYGIKHCVSCANGTDSLFIIMKMLGIGLGDEVITVSNSWISSSETISQTGAKPIFIDIHEEYYSINEKLIEQKISHKTKALLTVHLQGQMCEMDTLVNLCKKYNIFLIEDCAQSHFSEYKNKRAGTFGVAGSFSFYPGKNLGAYGDAGCIITNDDDFAKKCKMYARHGALIKHQHEIEGINSRLDGIQAAILTAKLPYILNWTEERIQHAEIYTQLLSDVPEVICPKVRPESKHTFHLYVIRAKQRNALAEFLKEKDIETSIHYPVPLPFLRAYNYLNQTTSDFPIANKYSKEILSLPLYPELTQIMIEYITEQIKKFYLIHSDKS